MKPSLRYPVAVGAVFVWIGFVGAISFMEAWLKFRAPGITVELGLGIGRLVFNALNKVEWVLAIGMIANFMLQSGGLKLVEKISYAFAVLLLAVQTGWLLPLLDQRAEAMIQGVVPGPSNHHFYYVGMEILKMLALLFLGIKLLGNSILEDK
jgi:hypothetical protein